MKGKKIVALGLSCLLALGTLAGCGGGTITGGSLSDDVIKVNKYKGLEVKGADLAGYEVSDDELAFEIDNRLQNSAPFVSKDKKAEAGDKIIIDYEGTADGKKVDDFSGNDVELELGQNTLYLTLSDGNIFDTAFLDHKKGDKIETDVVLSEGYGDLAGTTVKAKATIKDVQERDVPKLTDEWVASQGGEAKTVDEYKASVKKELESSHDSNLNDSKMEYVMEALADECEWVKEPKKSIDNYYESEMSAYESAAKEAGKTLDEYLEEKSGQSAEEIKKMRREAISKMFKEQYAVALIANSCHDELGLEENPNVKKDDKAEKSAEGNTEDASVDGVREPVYEWYVTDDDYEKGLDEYLKKYGYESKDAYFTAIGGEENSKDNLKRYFTQLKVIQYLVDNAVFEKQDTEKKTEDTTDVQATEQSTEGSTTEKTE
jgi:trigger factor